MVRKILPRKENNSLQQKHSSNDQEQLGEGLSKRGVVCHDRPISPCTNKHAAAIGAWGYLTRRKLARQLNKYPYIDIWNPFLNSLKWFGLVSAHFPAFFWANRRRLGIKGKIEILFDKLEISMSDNRFLFNEVITIKIIKWNSRAPCWRKKTSHFLDLWKKFELALLLTQDSGINNINCGHIFCSFVVLTAI